jgi:SAM-dependent methyltransferase
MIGPKTVLDIGCGAGYSLKYFIKEKGLIGVGVEGYEDAIKQSPVSSNIIKHDYTTGLLKLDRDFDFAWCCEFVEHVEEQYVDNFMKNFQQCKYVGMTHGVPGQPGFHHVNCQPAQYWIDMFKQYDFEYLENDTMILRRTLLKDKKLNTGYITGIPTEKQLETAVENAGGYDLFREITKDFYEASGYNNTIDIGTTKRILDKAYTRKRYGLLHYPITAELIKWLNIDKNYAKDILNKAANTLTINQIYLDKSGINLKYTVKTFSDGEFIFQSPSSTPYPVNNRIGFKMKKTPTAKNTLK